jgi:tetratricopeptide (TPR) repeat protein
VEAGLVSTEERDFLERSLADLERERAAGDLADDDYADLRARYESKLAMLTRAGAGTVTDGSRLQHQKRRGRGSLVLTALVVIAVGVGGGFGVAAWSGARKPGETLSGTVPSTSAQQLAEAAQLAGDGKVLDALKVYDGVLAENPEDVRALTYKGWLLRNVGVQSGEPDLAKQGVDYLRQATDIDPEFSEAWLFRGIVYLRDDADPVKATEALKNALASDPIPEVARAARELLAEIEQTPSTTSAGSGG